MLKVVGHEVAQSEVDERSLLDEIAREGAHRILVAALETEVAYLEAPGDERDDEGHALVVRNGKGRTRKITLGGGTIPVSAPRVNDRRTEPDGERHRFTSRILPPYMRRSPKVAEVLPVLYLRGLSTGDFREALAALLGDDASGLSATNLEADRLCTLVMIGARADGTKELIAVEDGYRESAESSETVLRAPETPRHARAHGRRGRRRPGFLGRRPRRVAEDPRAAELGPQARQHPRQGPAAVAAAREGRPARDHVADTRAHAREAITRFATEYGAKYPKAVTTLEQDANALLTFFDFPAEHWKHLRTSNVIESPFATVRLRQRVTKGAGSRTKGLLMAYKLLDMAQARWRRLDGAQLLPLVREGVAFVDGVQQAAKRGKPRAPAA